jgi:type IV secretory pathway TraG/TraD family ATPase VirD4
VPVDSALIDDVDRSADRDSMAAGIANIMLERTDPHAALLQRDTSQSQLFLGLTADGTGLPRWAGDEAHLLVLGPPRSGKTSTLIVPNILAAPGPVLSTSTKTDVLKATAPVRGRLGTCWVFDPAGSLFGGDDGVADPLVAELGVRELRWSPIAGCARWDDAIFLCAAMVATTSPAGGVSNESHWTERAEALLAPMLHAAALAELPMRTVVDWVSKRTLDPALAILEARGAHGPMYQLQGVERTDPRELSGIWSTTGGVLAAYRSSAALAAADEPNFDPHTFPSSRDTVYVCATGRQQRTLAPLVVGLIEELRSATYHANRGRGRHELAHVIFALDELANIAPIRDLGSILSEGASQGVQVLGCLQDLSQARKVWGEEAKGFPTLFSHKIILGGIGDTETLKSFSDLAGDWAKPVQTLSSSQGVSGLMPQGQRGESWTTQREPRLPISELANPPGGPSMAWLFDGASVSRLLLARYYESTPWSAIVATGQRPARQNLPPALPPNGVGQ